MADDVEDIDIDEPEDADDFDVDEDGEGSGEKKGLNGQKLVLFIVLPLLLIGGGAFAAFQFGLFGGGDEHEAEEQVSDKAAIFYEIPEMVVNLSGTGRQVNYLKVKIALEMEGGTDVLPMEAIMPRILDNFQVYLRELRLEDLDGSAGMFRLKEELLMRVNMAAHPTVVRDILFKEFLVQ